MENKLLWVGLFVLGAAVSWGVYVPTVHRATNLLNSNLRAFLFVGIAYFLVAVLVPAFFIFVLGDPTVARGKTPNFETMAMIWGIAAGIFGAAGALCVIFAAKTAGPGGAMYVAPLVFAGAPIINTLVTMAYFEPVRTLPDWRFFTGLLLAAVGAALVMIYRPKPEKGHAHVSPPAAVSVAASSGH
jgi:hypothetical protein